MPSDALVEFAGGRSRAIAGVIAIAVAAFWLVSATGGTARAQPRDNNPVGAIGLGVRGGPAGEAPVHAAPSKDGAESPVEFSFRAGLASDYIYRGTTLSDRKPAVGAAIEAAFSVLYAGSHRRQRQAADATGRRDHDDRRHPSDGRGRLRSTSAGPIFCIPARSRRSAGAPGSNIGKPLPAPTPRSAILLRVAGGFAYSPNVSNTGAWSKYAAFGLGVDLPSSALPQNVTASLTGGAGYFWFGNQSAELGGFPLPAYLNWNAGVTFTRKMLNLDLRYYDTNLSKEDCFVFTGDPNATPGGSIDPVRNPEGLRSRWCSATFVAKFWFALN